VVKYSLTGTGSTTIVSEKATRYCFLKTGLIPVYVRPVAEAYVININGVDSTLSGEFGITVWGDYLYVRSESGIGRYTVVGGTPTLDEFIEGPIELGLNISSSYIPVRMISETSTDTIVFSLIPDTDFVFPTNEVNELMTYLCAYAFVRKLSDSVKMQLIAPDIKQKWDQFYSVTKRDEYQFARINNDYQDSNNYY